MQNLYIIDGLDITSSVRPGVVNTAPNADSVQEVALQTNTYSVEYGRATSIQTAITTKSGANRVHGLASYYYTGNKLWARNEFTPTTGYAPFHYNNFSGAVGGPIYKDHNFLFASTQFLRSLNTTSGSTTFEAPEFVQFTKTNFPNSISTDANLSSKAVGRKPSLLVGGPAILLPPEHSGSSSTPSTWSDTPYFGNAQLASKGNWTQQR